MDPAVLDRATGNTIYRRLHIPVCVFLILYGAAKLAELADWSRLHRDVAAMLGLGFGAVTSLLIAGKGAELLLTVVAVLAVTSRRPRWSARRKIALLLASLAGWTVDLLVLAVVAEVSGDRGRLLEHGLAFIAFAVLLVVTYVHSGVTVKDVIGAVRRRRLPSPSPKPKPEPEPDATVRDTPGLNVTRQDLPVRRPEPPARAADTTLRDLPARELNVTRQDLPVRRRPSPEPPDDQDART